MQGWRLDSWVCTTPMDRCEVNLLMSSVGFTELRIVLFAMSPMVDYAAAPTEWAATTSTATTASCLGKRMERFLPPR